MWAKGPGDADGHASCDTEPETAPLKAAETRFAFEHATVSAWGWVEGLVCPVSPCFRWSIEAVSLSYPSRITCKKVY